MRSNPVFGCVKEAKYEPVNRFERLGRTPEFSCGLARDIYLRRYDKVKHKLYENDTAETISEIDKWAEDKAGRVQRKKVIA